MNQETKELKTVLELQQIFSKPYYFIYNLYEVWQAVNLVSQIQNENSYVDFKTYYPTTYSDVILNKDKQLDINKFRLLITKGYFCDIIFYIDKTPILTIVHLYSEAFKLKTFHKSKI